LLVLTFHRYCSIKDIIIKIQNFYRCTITQPL